MLDARNRDATSPTTRAEPHTAPEHDPRHALAERYLTQAARHLYGIPVDGARYGKLMDGVRASVFNDVDPATDDQALREVRALEDRYVITVYGVRNRTLLEQAHARTDHHAQAFKQTIEAIPEMLTRADPSVTRLANTLSRTFVRGMNDLKLGDACIAGGDLSRATSYAGSALKSFKEALAAKTNLELSLNRLAEQPGGLGEQAARCLTQIEELGIGITYLSTHGLNLLEKITDAGRKRD